MTKVEGTQFRRTIKVKELDRGIYEKFITPGKIRMVNYTKNIPIIFVRYSRPGRKFQSCYYRSTNSQSRVNLFLLPF